MAVISREFVGEDGVSCRCDNENVEIPTCSKSGPWEFTRQTAYNEKSPTLGDDVR